MKEMRTMREMGFLRNFWLITLISAYFGSYLSWYQMPGLFLYRLFFLLHGLFFLVIFFLRFSRGGKIKWGFQVGPYYLIFFTLWFIWGLVSLSWAPDLIFSLKHVCLLGIGCITVFFTIWYFSDPDQLKILFLVNILVLVLEIGLGLWELYGGYHIYGSFPKYFLRHNLLPVIGTFGHPNNFATYLSMFLPLLYAWGKNQKNKFAMFFSFTLLVCGIYLILSSTSRANMMAMILGSLLALILAASCHGGRLYRTFFKKIKQIKKINIKILVILILLILFIMIISSAALYPCFHQQFDLVSNQLTAEVMSVFVNWEYDGSIQLRKVLISKGIDMLKETYGLGVGAGNSQLLMLEHQHETYGYLKLHNWWVEVLVEYGVMIWTMLILFFARMFRDLWKIFKNPKDPSLKMWAEGLIISLAMFCVGVISNGSMTASAHLWIFFGLILAVINVSKQVGKEGKNL